MKVIEAFLIIAQAIGLEHQGTCVFETRKLYMGQESNGYNSWPVYWDPLNNFNDAMTLALTFNLTVVMDKDKVVVARTEDRKVLTQEAYAVDATMSHKKCMAMCSIVGAALILSRQRLALATESVSQTQAGQEAQEAQAA